MNPNARPARPIRAAALALTCLAAVALVPVLTRAADPKPNATANAEGFIPLFDGKSLDGWKANEKPEVFKVEDGNIVVNGPRSHLFYVGPVKNHDFKDFHLRVEAKTFPKANSGIYFHTKFQDEGWPAAGYEVQVNQTHGDAKKTGGLYAVKDVLNESPVKDNEWYTYDIIVKGKQITVKVNGKTTAEFTEPADWQPPANMPGRRLGSGTFALQGHDPESKVLYRSILVKPLD